MKADAEQKVKAAQNALAEAKQAAIDTPAVKAAQAELDKAQANLDKATDMLKQAEAAYKEATATVTAHEQEVTTAKATLAALLAGQKKNKPEATTGKPNTTANTIATAKTTGTTTATGTINTTGASKTSGTVTPESVQATDHAANLLASTGMNMGTVAGVTIMLLTLGAGTALTVKRRN